MNQSAKLEPDPTSLVKPKDNSPFNISLADKIARIQGVEHLACDCSGSSMVIFRECVIWLAVAGLLWVAGLYFVLV